MMNEIDERGNYNETDKKWKLHRVYNYHLETFSKGETNPAFVDYHEFLFDVLEIHHQNHSFLYNYMNSFFYIIGNKKIIKIIK